MTTKNYVVTLKDGSRVTIEGVADPNGVEKDGSGLRLRDPDGNILASFDDGQSKSCWPASAAVETPPDPVEPEA